jgi:hypothetical protein
MADELAAGPGDLTKRMPWLSLARMISPFSFCCGLRRSGPFIAGH